MGSSDDWRETFSVDFFLSRSKLPSIRPHVRMLKATLELGYIHGARNPSFMFDVLTALMAAGFRLRLELSLQVPPLHVLHSGDREARVGNRKRARL